MSRRTTGQRICPRPANLRIIVWAGNLSLPKPKVWQASFYDHVVRNKKEFVQRLNYIHDNPVRAKLADKPENYKYSSATGKCETDLEGYVGG